MRWWPFEIHMNVHNTINIMIYIIVSWAFQNLCHSGVFVESNHKGIWNISRLIYFCPPTYIHARHYIIMSEVDGTCIWSFSNWGYRNSYIILSVHFYQATNTMKLFWFFLWKEPLGNSAQYVKRELINDVTYNKRSWNCYHIIRHMEI